MKKLILMVFLMLLISNLYCEEKQDIDAILHPNYLNNNMLAQNEIINDTIQNTQPAIKDTVSQDSLLKRPKICFTCALDAAVLPGIRVGFGWIDYDTTLTKENIVTVHVNSVMFISTAHVNSVMSISTAGIFCTVNNFTSPQRLGFYTSYSIGADYCITTDGYPGGGPGHTEQYLFPNITFGIGHSYKIGDSSFLRISGDLGLKWIVASLSFSFVF